MLEILFNKVIGLISLPQQYHIVSSNMFVESTGFGSLWYDMVHMHAFQNNPNYKITY